jgi:hypothetical protein
MGSNQAPIGTPARVESGTEKGSFGWNSLVPTAFDKIYDMSYICRMSIRIVIQASGLNISANLKDEALTAILQLIQEKRDDSAAAPPVPSGPPAGHGPVMETSVGNGSEEWIKAALTGRGGAELLNQFKWENYPEKILLLGAWHEARGGTTPWRSADMDETFKQAKENPPSNFPRDIKSAIKSGWIHNETPRTYTVTRTGWNKIGQALKELPS